MKLCTFRDPASLPSPPAGRRHSTTASSISPQAAPELPREMTRAARRRSRGAAPRGERRVERASAASRSRRAARARRSCARRSSSRSASTTPTTSPRRASRRRSSRPSSTSSRPASPARATRSTCRASRTALDYEGELGFVIGRRCRHVPRERAHEVIAGYLVVNDVIVRDWQLRVPTWTMGKSFDTHGPIGPWITTRRRDRRSARPAPAHLGERRAAPGLEHEAPDLRLLRAGRAPLDGLHARARRRDRDRHARRRRHRDEAAAAARGGRRVRVEIEGLGALENEVVPEPA